MCNLRFFQPPQPQSNNLLKDVVRLLRDALAIANDFFNLPLLTAIVNYLNQLTGDIQTDDAVLHP